MSLFSSAVPTWPQPAPPRPSSARSPPATTGCLTACSPAMTVAPRRPRGRRIGLIGTGLRISRGPMGSGVAGSGESRPRPVRCPEVAARVRCPVLCGEGRCVRFERWCVGRIYTRCFQHYHAVAASRGDMVSAGFTSLVFRTRQSTAFPPLARRMLISRCNQLRGERSCENTC